MVCLKSYFKEKNIGYSGINQCCTLLHLIALEFTQRVSALALVDSVHSKSNIKGRPVIELFNDHVRQWVASKEKLDTEMPYHTKDAGCPCVSSGHSPHLPFYFSLPG